jgi:hypothetical protein
MTERSKILLAMPCAHSFVKMGTMRTMTELGIELANAGYAVGVATISVSDLVFARNYLASIALRDGCSHIFFVDSDMSFPPSLGVRLARAEKDVIGLIYPRRALDMQEVVRIAREQPDIPSGAVVSKAMDYVVRLPARTTFTNGLAEVDGLGMGGTLIRTSVLQKMVERGVVERRQPPMKMSGKLDLWGFFDLWVTPKGDRLSEDYSFCTRWKSCGGTVWGFDTVQVEHIGDFSFSGSLLIKSGQPEP